MSRPTLAPLLQLASPTLPVGAFSYSSGLEWAVAAGQVRDEASARDWITAVLEEGVAVWDAPWVAALMRAWAADAAATVAALNARFLASRETRELRAETAQMGRAMLAVLQDGELPAATAALLARLEQDDGLAYPTAWAAAAVLRGVAVEDALVAYLWAWLENMVMAALKTVPLGQRAGQRLLTGLGERLGGLAADAAARPLDQCRNLLPGFTLASMHHETQYTRLFRS